VRRRYAYAAIALVCGVALVVGAGVEMRTGAGRPARPAVLLGVAHDDGVPKLVRVAPVSLRPLPGPRLRLQGPLGAWALSPDGRRLAAVSDRASVLQLIEVERMRTVGRVRMLARGSPAAVIWPRRDRMWIVLAESGCCAVGTTTVVTVDAIANRVLSRRRLAGGLARVAASPNGPVLLLAPSALIGPAWLATVDAGGAVEQVPLDGVSAGLMPTALAPSVERVRTPALAVDSDGRRAYVMSSRPYVAEVDLRRRRVSGHRLVARTSLADRLRELLEPSAEAYARVGPVRDAAWIGEGRIALSGYDGDALWRSDGGVEGERRPAGLHVIDTRDWSIRTLDERASSFVAAAGLLLTNGPEGRGLAAYSPDGGERFRVFDGRHVEIVASAGSLAYVRTPPEPALQVVDLARGRVIGTSAPGRPTLLLERAADWRYSLPAPQ
jgi:WD40-like Beta Propeller Repeat